MKKSAIISKIIEFLFWPGLIFHLYTASYYALKGELNFQTDIGRDFLLFEEILQKKIVLIGGRTSAAGLFHGPLWSYINFPVFWLSRGNPVAQEWFWLFLIVLFLFFSFQICKDLFGKTSAFIFVLLTSSFLAFWAKEFTHPHAAFLLMPFFFYTLIKYTENFKIKWLIYHVLLSGFIVQLEVAAGGPFLVLSYLYILFKQYKQKHINQALGFLVILLPLSPYILFDLKHNFFQIKNLIVYVLPHPKEHYVGLSNILTDRLNYATTFAVPLLHNLGQLKLLNIFFALVFLILTILRLQEKKIGRIYWVFLYFFFGYFIISLLSRYYLLTQDFLPLVSVVFMIFASLSQPKFAKTFLVMFLVVYTLNIYAGTRYLSESKKTMSSSLTSWRILSKISQDTFSGPENEFGYFVYSPDKLSYSAKYALVYGSLNSRKKAYYFEKKPVTYVISEAPAYNDPWAKNFTDVWWIKNSIKIKPEPELIIHYKNGYELKKYNLTPDEINIPWDKQEDTGLHFR